MVCTACSKEVGWPLSENTKTMAIIHGKKANGKNGVLSNGELASLIHRKSGERAKLGNCATCATHIENMSDTAGQGGITTKYAGKTVFHISSGQKGKGDGCSVFFTLSADNGPALVAGIVGVGWHAGNNDHTYLLDWGKGPPFFTKGRLDTSKQEQKGNR